MFQIFQYSVMILDEVHERTLYTDIVLGLMKKILKRRRDLRLVISSATVDADQLYNFFNFNTTNNKEKDTAAVISVEGRTHPVDIHYLEGKLEDFLLKFLFYVHSVSLWVFLLSHKHVLKQWEILIE